MTQLIKNKIRAVIFDLDGTLVDTEKSGARALQECCEALGVQLTSEDASYLTGRTWGATLDYLFKKHTFLLPKVELQERILTRYQQLLSERLEVVPGSAEAVRSIAQQYPVGLVSGSHRKEILWALGQLGILSHFQVIYGAEDYPKSKPAPDGYLKALETLGIAPDECLIFEDSKAGIASARQAGAWVVAVTLTNHFQQDVSQSHFTVKDLLTVNAEWVRNLKI